MRNGHREINFSFASSIPYAWKMLIAFKLLSLLNYSDCCSIIIREITLRLKQKFIACYDIICIKYILVKLRANESIINKNVI